LTLLHIVIRPAVFDVAKWQLGQRLGNNRGDFSSVIRSVIEPEAWKTTEGEM
jgi:hypothetical protein